jgi:hypothetical protein
VTKAGQLRRYSLVRQNQIYTDEPDQVMAECFGLQTFECIENLVTQVAQEALKESLIHAAAENVLIQPL